VVDHTAGDTGIRDDKGTLGVEQADIRTAGKPCHLHGPGPRRIDYLSGPDAACASGACIAAQDAGDNALSDLEMLRLCMRQKETSGQLLGMADVLQGDPEWVHGGIRNRVSGEHPLRQSRLPFPGFGRGQGRAVDACCSAMIGKTFGKPGVVPLHRNEQAATLIDALGSDPFQNISLLSAFRGGFRIRGGVAAATVQQTVVTPGSTGVEITAIDQQAVYASQCQVAHHPGAGNTAADDKYLGLEGLGSACLYRLHRCSPGFKTVTGIGVKLGNALDSNFQTRINLTPTPEG